MNKHSLFTSTFATHTQLRRARALFPCVDEPGRLASYELWLSVPPQYVGVGGGSLKGSVLVGEEGSEVSGDFFFS